MAEILVKAISATHLDPIKDARGCYKQGDIVVVAPDGHTWGREECLPKFYVFKLPGLSVEEARYLMDKGDGIRRKYAFPFSSKVSQANLDLIASSNWLVLDADISDITVK